MENNGWRYVDWDNDSVQAKNTVNGLLVNPFRGLDGRDMDRKVEDFMFKTGLDRQKYFEIFRKGAHVALAQGDSAFDMNTANFEPGINLSEDELQSLQNEDPGTGIRRFRQPPLLYALVACCSLGAAVQGWDETAVNQAQLLYQKPLGLDNSLILLGLVNSAPYLCCAVLGCWLSDPVNRWMGRRGAIFVACAVSSLTCLWQALVNTWPQLFIARFLLGIGIGIKSATVPVYASESTPKYIRGALVMSWQLWTAFGIMLGYITGPVFQNVTSNLGWRLILGGPMVLPLIVCTFIYMLPESPRWLLARARKHGSTKCFLAAYHSLLKLRSSEIQAARDLFLMYYMLEQEDTIRNNKSINRFLELFRQRRNRRALTASVIVMFMQQFCGVNVFEYYSSLSYADAKYTRREALQLSAGFGVINFVFAIPAIPLIDSFGRRKLLLATFPFLALFQLLTGLGYLARNTVTRKALVVTGSYLFCIAYSPGEGPVPFVYSSESMPLYVRDLGMSMVTAINWAFNFLLGITFPRFRTAFTLEGAFGYYAAWCVIGWFLILLFVPETKNLTLEQLDAVFSGRSSDHAMYGLRQVKYFFLVTLYRRKGMKAPVALTVADPAKIPQPIPGRQRQIVRLHSVSSAVTHPAKSSIEEWC